MSLTWSAGMFSGSRLLAPVLVQLLAQLGDDEREVVAGSTHAPRRISKPPMIVDGTPSTSTAARGPNASVKQRGEQRAAGRADEEHVDRAERGAHARAAGTARPTAAPARPS